MWLAYLGPGVNGPVSWSGPVCTQALGRTWLSSWEAPGLSSTTASALLSPNSAVAMYRGRCHCQMRFEQGLPSKHACLCPSLPTGHIRNRWVGSCSLTNTVPPIGSHAIIRFGSCYGITIVSCRSGQYKCPL